MQSEEIIIETECLRFVKKLRIFKNFGRFFAKLI